MVGEETLYDGVGAAELKAKLGLPRVDVYDSIPSTMDAAHAAADAGAPAGTLVLADRQTAGRLSDHPDFSIAPTLFSVC